MQKSNVVVLTATKTEKEATNDYLDYYFRGRYDKERESHCVIRAFQSVVVHIIHMEKMGNMSAAYKVANIIRDLHPVCIVACGVCAGIPAFQKDKNLYGLIKASVNSVYYELQKVNSAGEFEPRHEVFQSSISRQCFDRFLKLSKRSQDQWIYLLKTSPQGSATPEPGIDEAWYTSGEKVVSDAGFRDNLKKILADDNIFVTAIDMESSGVAYACRNNATNFIIAKGVCDFAEFKEDSWQKFAATASIIHALNWCESLSDDDVKRLFLDRLLNLPPTDYDKMICLADIAGKHLAFGGAHVVSHKGFEGSDEVVTYFDKLNQEFIEKHLGPGCLTVVEEEIGSGDDSAVNFDLSKPCVYIDPVDGSLNLSAGRSEVAISIAQYHGLEPVGAVINMPFRGLSVSASRAKDGICVNNAPWPRRRKIPGEIRDSFVALPGDVSKIIKNSNMPAEFFYSLISAFFKCSRVVRVTGALAYDLACLALGEIDIRISTHAKNVDIAAGALLVRNSGGVVTDFQGNEWQTTTKSLAVREQDKSSFGVVATASPSLHRKVLDFVQEYLVRC